MGTTGDAQSAAPHDTQQAAPSRGKWPYSIEDLGRLAGGSAVDGPLGLLAMEEDGGLRIAVVERELADGECSYWRAGTRSALCSSLSSRTRAS